MAAKPPKNKPFRITCFCPHGLGHSQYSEQAVNRILRSKQFMRAEGDVAEDGVHYIHADGRRAVLARRRVCKSDYYASRSSYPELTREDIVNSHLLVSPINPEAISAWGSPELEDPLRDAVRLGKLVTGPKDPHTIPQDLSKKLELI